jgi:tetratricopeptide (TPR) repeat protein
MGRVDESLGEIDRAIELAPDLAIAHGSRALTLRAMGREDEALAEEAKERELSGE